MQTVHNQWQIFILSKKRKNHRRKKSQQGKQNTPSLSPPPPPPPPPPHLSAQDLDPPLIIGLPFNGSINETDHLKKQSF